MVVAPLSSRVSSANPEWFIFLMPSSNLMPVMRPDCLFWSREQLNYSAMRMKRYGDKGQPCLSPLEDWKEGLGLPLMRGAIQGREMYAPMKLIRRGEKPILWRTANKNECLTLSNALAKSSFRMKPFSFLGWLEWMASWTRRIESEISLLAIKPPWFSEISIGRRGLSREAMILVKILYDELHKDIGLKREKLDGSSP